MVEAVAMTITAAIGMAMEAETVTQAAGMISTQVAETELAGKNGACHHQWIEAIHLHVIHTAAQVGVFPVVVAEEAADLIEEVAEADTKVKKMKHGPKTFYEMTMWHMLCLYHQRTTTIKEFVLFFFNLTLFLFFYL